jgi:hypothetical protein
MKAITAALVLVLLADGPVFAAGSPSFPQAQLAYCYLGNQFIWIIPCWNRRLAPIRVFPLPRQVGDQPPATVANASRRWQTSAVH